MKITLKIKSEKGSAKNADLPSCFDCKSVFFRLPFFCDFRSALNR